MYSKEANKGQTTIEYMLIFVVMVTIITGLLSYIKSKYLGDLKNCKSKAQKETILCKINSIISPAESGKKFQYYRIK